MLLVFLACCFLLSHALSPGMYMVSPFVGTGGDGWGIGETPVGAQRPFGMARVSPDSVEYNNLPIPGAWRHNGGYYYYDEYIRVFSHTHMVGAGVADLGTIAVMPFSRVPTPDDIWNYGFRSTFSHDQESTLPGYYSVVLSSSQVKAEMTATLHTGVHRYTWSSGSTSRVILFPISHSIYSKYPEGCKGANITVDVSTGEVFGWMINQGSFSGRLGGYNSYFVAQFSAPIKSYGVWSGKQVYQNVSFQTDPGNIVNPNGIGAYVEFDASVSAVEMYVGISSINISHARRNLVVEVNGRNFSTVLQETLDSWDSLFSRATAIGGRPDDQRKFYTALYHSLLAPTIFSEADRLYLGFDSKVHVLPSDMNAFYTDMSIWDVHRSEFPWISFFLPDVMSDIVKSLLLMREQGGDLPRWPFLNGYTGSMSGQHSVICLVDAFVKGIQMNTEEVYQAVRQALTGPFTRVSFPYQDWYQYGYIPFDTDQTGATWTLDLSYDSWAVATMAKALGKTDDYNYFYNSSQNWKNIFNSEYKFFCAKTKSGQWACPSTWINVFDEHYIEGDAWHYRFFVPGDVDGLVSLFGKDSFVSELSTFMFNGQLDYSNFLPNPYYWAGNEPDILSVYEFVFAGRADLTQRYLRWLLEYQYTMDPSGLPGNDDYGTMSAWYLWGTLGIYPLSASTTFMLGSPMFDSVTITFLTNNTSSNFTVKAYNASHENIFVDHAAVNGKPIDVQNRALVDWSDLNFHAPRKNVLLEFWMKS